MGSLSDRCQCCASRLGESYSYRCETCLGQGYCTQCGKCKHHCEHVKRTVIEAGDGNK